MKNMKFFVLLSFLHFGILFCYTDSTGRINYCHNSSQQKSSNITTLIPALGFAKAGISFVKGIFSSSSAKKQVCSCDLCKVKRMSTQEIWEIKQKLESHSLYANDDSVWLQ